MSPSKTYHENMKTFCNSFLTASKPRWFLIGWQREQEVFFWGVSVWLLLLNCCCERLAAWCGDGTVWEQVTQRSHQPCTRGTSGGAWCVSVGGHAKDSLRRKSGRGWMERKSTKRVRKSLRLFSPQWQQFTHVLWCCPGTVFIFNT